jgi:predicted RNA binding protein YcfA (HicA-like mRNA interferase family)
MSFTAKEVLSKLLKADFQIKRQSGSHIILRHKDGGQTYVAMHTKDIPEGTLRKILKQANLSFEDLKKL